MGALTFYCHNIVIDQNHVKNAINVRKLRMILWYVKRLGFKPCDLSSFLRHLSAGKRAKTCLMTLDDGYSNNFDLAVPELDRAGFKGVFFVITSRIGQAGYMGKNQLAALLKAGHAVGSHTVSHPRLRNIGRDGIMKELKDSRKCLEDMLGAAVTALAYPKGEYSDVVIDCAREAGYEVAFATKRGLAHSWGNRFCLRRYPVSGRDSGLGFVTKTLRRMYLSTEVLQNEI